MTALITGGTSGIGKEIAILLGQKGYDLLLVSRQTNDLGEIRKACHTQVDFLSLDLTKEDDNYRLLKETQGKEITIAVINAGFGLLGPLEKTSVETEVDMVKLNDISALILTKGFLTRFKSADKGRVLVTCSAASFGAAPYMAVYYATKAFVYSLVHGYHRELRLSHSDVTISALCPGPVKTGFEKRGHMTFQYRAADPKSIAKAAVRGLLKGRLEIVPGLGMKLAHVGSHLVSKRIISKTVHKQAEPKS